jgi:hypothetical protein
VDPLVVVTHPDPIQLEARSIRYESLPEDAVALGYYHDGFLIARGVVSPDAVEAIRSLLVQPVTLALAAAEDEDGNIDARVCLVLPIDPDMLSEDDGEESPDEPWKSSLPALPSGIESLPANQPDQSDRTKLALLPIGNVVRNTKDRNHPDDVVADVREMLDNLVGGKAQDAVQKAIDDLLNSI